MMEDTNVKENKIVWTVEQERVIDTRKGNILVSAAAGSGKTAVLVERIVNMVTGTDSKGNKLAYYEPCDVDKLLVVTFTNAAAAQMKEKIAKALQAKTDDMQKKGEHDEHLIKQSTLIGHADICTIDSFCLKIVKEYFARVDIDSAFDIADDTEMKLIRKDVMDAVFESCYSDMELVPGFERLVRTFAKKERDTELSDIIFRIERVISSYPEPDEWLSQAKKAWDAGGDIYDSQLVKSFALHVRRLINSSFEGAKKCLEYAISANAPDKVIEKLDKDIELLTHLKNSCDKAYEDKSIDADLFEIKRIYESEIRIKGVSKEVDDNGDKLIYAFDPFYNIFGKTSEEAKNRIKAGRQEYIDLLSDVIESIPSEDEYIKQIKMMGPVMCTLIDLTKLYISELMKVKMDKNLFEFHDIEQFAYRILCDGVKDGKPVPSRIGREVSERYREILIDEYQDSNFLQEYILGSVAGYGAGIDNTFMVGDVKQSIYRFRMARPDLFIHKYDTYSRTDDNANGTCILLNRNYRSEINVLKTVNTIFSRIMKRELGDIEYDDRVKLNSRYAAMEGDSFKEPDNVSQGYQSEFVVITNDIDKVDPDGMYNDKNVEASYIASRIKEMVEGPSPLYITDEGKKRKLRYSDIAVLLRSVSGASAEYEKAFEDAHIPLYIDSEDGYFAAPEVSTLICMLSVIDNSYIDYDLAAVLRSPLVGLDEEQLAQIVGEYRQRYELEGTDYNKRLYDKIVDYIEVHTEAVKDDDKDSEADGDGAKKIMDKLLAFDKLLLYLKKNKNYMSISDIIRYVLDSTGFYWFCGARAMGRRRQANIDMLIKKADDFEKNSKGVFNFIRYIGELRTNDLDFAEAEMIGENDDVVRVMTMHKSKGLEFPVVFAAGLGKSFFKKDLSKGVLIHQDYYLACNLIDPDSHVKKDSFVKKMMKEIMLTELYSEELRVLYVALTRAKEKLIMTSCFESDDKEHAKWSAVSSISTASYGEIMSADCPATWIYPAVCSCDTYAQVKEVKCDDFVEGASQGAIRIKGFVAAKEKESSEYKNDEKLLADIRKGLEFEYRHKMSGLKSKMSITEVKKLQAKGEEFDPGIRTGKNYEKRKDFPVPSFLCQKESVYGNDIGTIYHKIMELIDFADTSLQGVQKAVSGVFGLGLFDKVYEKHIYPEKIKRMLESPLGRRMAAAEARNELYREKQFYMLMKPDEIIPSLKGFDDENIVVQGIIDGYFIEDGEIVVMDYKTDTIKKESELADRHRVQIDMYAWVLERLTGLKVKEKYLYSFCLDTTVNL